LPQERFIARHQDLCQHVGGVIDFHLSSAE